MQKKKKYKINKNNIFCNIFFNWINKEEEEKEERVVIYFLLVLETYNWFFFSYYSRSSYYNLIISKLIIFFPNGRTILANKQAIWLVAIKHETNKLSVLLDRIWVVAWHDLVWLLIWLCGCLNAFIFQQSSQNELCNSNCELERRSIFYY